LSPASQSKVASARGIVRSLYALSRYVRLFGLKNERTDAQVEACMARVRALIPAAGIRVALNGDRINVDSIDLEVTPAEQSFARLLREIPHNAFSFDEKFTREALEDISSAMANQQPATQIAAPSAVPTVPVDDGREWLSGPFRLLGFLNVAVHDTGSRPGESAPPTEPAWEDIAQLLHIVGRLARSASDDEARGAGRDLQRVPHHLLNLLREILVDFSELQPPPAGDALVLRLADRVVIRSLMAELEKGTISIAQIPDLLDRLGRQLKTLRTILPVSQETVARGVTLEALLETLERDFWHAAPESVRHGTVLSDTPYYVTPSAIDVHLQRLIAQGEAQVADRMLQNYGAAVDGRDAEGRRRSAKGIAELADLYALVVPEYVPKLVRSISRQLMREPDLRMQSLLSTALVRLSYAVLQQRDFGATAAASDALEEISHRRPALGMELRPRISVENRLTEYVEEALSSTHASDDLVGLLQRHPGAVAQQLCGRFLQCSLRDESTRLMVLAERLGAESRAELLRRLRTGSSDDALSAAGLVSVLAPEEAAVILPRRATDWNRAQQDILIRQLATAASPKRADLLVKLIPHLDTLIVGEAIDEIGMSADLSAAGTLMEIALAGQNSRFTAYSQVKAIEALGRMRAAQSANALQELLQDRKMLHWAQPHELRIAALQALHMIDPEKAANLLPRSGVTAREVSLGPLAVDAETPWARQRRYSRVFPLKPMAAIATSNTGRAGLEIVELSLGGGRARRQRKAQPGGDLTLQLQLALRRLNSQVLVRESTGSEISFEIADIGLSDRTRLRHLLLAQTPSPSPRAAA
jgi:hypothetical protein